jgi:hypothetical protein
MPDTSSGVNLHRVKSRTQVVFTPGTTSFWLEPKRQGVARHRFFGKPVGPLFPLFLPLPGIRVTELPDFDMPLNWPLGRIEEGLPFAVREYPVSSGDPGEIAFLDPFPACLRMSSAGPAPQAFPEILLPALKPVFAHPVGPGICPSSDHRIQEDNQPGCGA